MKVCVAGAGGVLGTRLVRQLVARGHTIVGVVLQEEDADAVRAAGGQPSGADVFEPGELARAAHGAEVVIHVASAPQVSTDGDPASFDLDDRLRRQATEALTLCAARVGARYYLQRSVLAVARPLDGSVFDETAPPVEHASNASARDAERAVRRAAEHYGFDAGILRLGWIYAADDLRTMHMGEDVMARRLPVIGTGEARWSLVHGDDAASAFVAAAELGRPGTWHVVDDHPVTMGDYVSALARRLRAPAPPRLPAWLARWTLGRRAVEEARYSVRTSNALFQRQVGWRPRYPIYTKGLDQIVTAWFNAGFLLREDDSTSTEEWSRTLRSIQIGEPRRPGRPDGLVGSDGGGDADGPGRPAASDRPAPGNRPARDDRHARGAGAARGGRSEHPGPGR